MKLSNEDKQLFDTNIYRLFEGYQIESNVIFIYDQVENIIDSPNINSFDKILFSLCLLAYQSIFKVNVILSVRDTYLYKLVGFLKNLPRLFSEIFSLTGISHDACNDLFEYCSKKSGIIFDEKLRTHIFRDLSINREVNPLELQLVCSAVFDEIVGKEITGFDAYERLGRVDGIYGSFLDKKLVAFPAYQRGELLKVLKFLCGTKGTTRCVNLSDLVSQLEGYDQGYVNELIDSLIGVKLVLPVKKSAYMLCHDAMIEIVKSRYLAADRIQGVHDLVAEGVTQWVRYDIFMGKDRLEVVEPWINEIELTVVETIFLALSLKECGSRSENRDIIRRFKNIPFDKIANIFIKHLLEHNRKYLKKAEVFMFLIHNSLESFEYLYDYFKKGSIDKNLFDADIYSLVKESMPSKIKKHIFKLISDINVRVNIRWGFLKYSLNFFPEEISTILHKLTSDPEVLIRSAVYAGMVYCFQPKQLFDYGRLALEDEEVLVKLQGISLLGKSKTSEARELLIGMLNHSDARLRKRAIIALGFFGDSSTVDAISKCSDDPNSFVRESVFEVLGEHVDEKYINVYIEGLSDSISYVRESACYCVGKIASKNVESALSTLLNDTASNVREAAFIALQRQEATVSRNNLIESLVDGNTSTKIKAIERLSYFDSDEVVNLLIDFIDNDESQDARDAAISALGNMKQASAVQALHKCLNEFSGLSLCNVIVALQNIGEPSSAEELIKFVYHPDEDIRERVVYALSELGGETAIGGLIECLDDFSNIIRVRAIYGLGRLRAERAADRIRNIIHVEDLETKRAIQYFNDEIKG